MNPDQQGKHLMEIVTACTLDCPDACSLCVEKGLGGGVTVRGNPEHPFTQGFTCAKARSFPRRLQSLNRITTPLLKQGAQWRAASWDEALDLCARKIQEYRSDAPASILHIHGEGGKGLMKLLTERFFAELGGSTIRGCLCDGTGIAACMADFGALESNDVRGLRRASAIVNWGKDLSRSSVHTAAIVKKARRKGTAVLTITPGGDGNGPYTDHFIRIRPGTDRFLAAAVIQLLLRRNRIQEGILKQTANWPAFRGLLEAHSLQELVRACDADAEGVERVYEAYAGDEPAATLLGWGLQRYARGGENVRFINALALLSGNIGRPGGGSTFNISSLRNFDLSWTRPAEPKLRRSFLLPRIGEEILQADRPPVSMIWVNGHNIINQAPDSRTIARAFEKTSFKVVVDAFMNDTAQRADCILPCALMFERDDIVGSFLHDYVNDARKVLEPPGEAWSDFEIVRELGKRLHPPVEIPELEDCFRQALNSPYLDLSLEELRQKGYVRARRPEVAFADGRFAHPDGKYRFPETLHSEPNPAPDYPLQLLTLVRRDAVHSQIPPEDHPERPRIWISPECPAWDVIRADQPVFLASPLGRLEVEVQTEPGLHPEAVIYRRGDWMKLGGGANRLIAPRVTDMGEGTAFYSQRVRLENGEGQKVGRWEGGKVGR
jgi:anaerobic selenocysteine-containing dehydrogenase